MADPKVAQGQELSQEDYVELARRRLNGFGRGLKELTEANEALVEGTGDQEYTFTGNAFFQSFVIWSEVDVWITVNDGTKLHYRGTSWGSGAGGGWVWGGGTFGYIPPSEVIGDCDFELHSLAEGLQINWHRGSEIIGTFMAAGAAVGLGVFHGSGHWKYDTGES
jgi:hypothetical protein